MKKFVYDLESCDVNSMYPAMMQAWSKPTSPWEYLRNWEMSDRGPDETLAKLNERMQNRWPGNYKIVKDQRWNGHNYWVNIYEFKFNEPKDETMFKLRYS